MLRRASVTRISVQFGNYAYQITNFAGRLGDLRARMPQKQNLTLEGSAFRVFPLALITHALYVGLLSTLA